METRYAILRTGLLYSYNENERKTMRVSLVPLVATQKEIEDRKSGSLTEPFNKDEIKLALFCTRHIVHMNPSFPPFVTDIKIEKLRNSMSCDVTHSNPSASSQNYNSNCHHVHILTIFISSVFVSGGHQQHQHTDVAVPRNRRPGHFLQMGIAFVRSPQEDEPQQVRV